MDTVLVGVFEPKNNIEREMMHERRSLIEKLNETKVPCIAVHSIWPRDDFICHKSNVYFREKYGHYADGGYVRAYPDFTIACAGVSENEERGFADSPEQRIARLRSLYGPNIQIVPNPDYTLNDELRPHSDMVIFPITDKKIVFVDQIYLTAHRELIENFAQRYKLEIRGIKNDYDNPSWPCNTLSLRNGAGLVNVTNQTHNEAFIGQLQSLGHKVIGVPFMNNCRKGGSVHCATNTIPGEKLPELREIYDL
jgi:hypothetical protein